jgi:hypothetical protein
MVHLTAYGMSTSVEPLAGSYAAGRCRPARMELRKGFKCKAMFALRQTNSDLLKLGSVAKFIKASSFPTASLIATRSR